MNKYINCSFKGHTKPTQLVCITTLPNNTFACLDCVIQKIHDKSLLIDLQDCIESDEFKIDYNKFATLVSTPIFVIG